MLNFSETSSLERTQVLRSMGFSLIPVPSGQKIPVIKWKPYQSRYPTEAEHRAWFGNGHPGQNTAIITGAISRLVVVDADGPEAVAWAEENLPPSPLRTKTAKGIHYYYRHPGGHIRNKARLKTDFGKLPLDIRADGGYVMAPGSKHPSGFIYQAEGDWSVPVESLPLFDRAWIVSVDSPIQPPSLPSRSSESIPKSEIVARARAYLAKVPGAVQGEGGDTHTLSTACRIVRGFDLPKDVALKLLLDWNQKCTPPWTEQDIRQKIENAIKYGTEPYGHLLVDSDQSGINTDEGWASKELFAQSSGGKDSARELSDSGEAASPGSDGRQGSSEGGDSLKGLKLSRDLKSWISTGKVPARFASAKGDPHVRLMSELIRTGIQKDSILAIFSDDGNAISTCTATLTEEGALQYLETTYLSAVKTLLPSVRSIKELERLEGAPSEAIIEDLLYEGETVLEIGRAKIGKSAKLEQMACCLASGTDFLGHKIATPKRVLYIDLENQPYHLRKRFEEIGKRIKGEGWKERFHIAAFETLGENVFGMDHTGFARLKLAVSEFRPDVLILDSLRLLGAGDLNDSRDVVKFLKEISELRKIHPKLAIIIVHHLRKEDRKGKKLTLRESPETWIEDASGSQALVAHVDSIWGLDVERKEGDETVVFAMVRRNGIQRTLLLTREIDEWGDSAIGFRLLADADPGVAEEKLFTEKERRIWNALSATFRWPNLVDAAGGPTQKRIASSILTKARTNGLVSERDKEYAKIRAEVLQLL